MAERVLKVTVLSDFRKFRSDQRELENGFTRFSTRMRGTGTQLQGFGALLTGGAVAVGLKSATDAATGLETQTKRVGASFGTAAEDIRDFAKNADDSLGLSERAALEAAAGFGLVADAVGFSDKQAATFAKDLTGLASTMATATGRAPAEAIEALGDAFRGEFDTLDNFGVKLSAGAVQAELLRMGADKLTGKQREQAEVMATLNLLHQRSAPLVAQAAANAGSQADRQAKLNAQWENAKAALGERLLPVLADATEQGTKLLTAFSNLDEETGGMASRITLLGGAIVGTGILASTTVGKLLETRNAWKAYKAEKLAQIPVNTTVGTSEATLAAKTTAAGNAAATAGGKWSSLAGVLGKGVVGGVLIGSVVALGKAWSDSRAEFDRMTSDLAASQSKLTAARAELADLEAQIRAGADSAGEFGIDVVGLGLRQMELSRQVADAERKVREQSEAVAEAKTAQAAAAPVTAQLSGLTINLGTASANAKEKIKTYREAIKQASEQVAGAIPVFEGYARNKDITTGSIIRNLRREAGAYSTWADDVQRLIRRGADPKFLQELSEKGPDFVHAMASGSDRELALAERFFQRRTKGMNEVARENLRLTGDKFKQLEREANAAIRGIRGKNIKVTATASMQASGQILREFLTGGIRREASGGFISGPGTTTSDSIPALLSDGEFVVNAAATRANRGLLEAINARRMARGGLVGDAGDAPGVRITPFGSVSDLEIKAARFQRAINLVGTALGRVLGSMLGPNERAVRALSFARAQLGEPYLWGGAGPDAWDCSGLTMMGARAAGVSIPRVARDQARSGRGVSRSAARMGDLIYFARAGQGAHHIGWYLGRDTMLHAPHTGDVVRISGGRVGTGYRRIFDAGGVLWPGVNVVENRTGRPEPVVPAHRSGGGDVHVHLHGPFYVAGDARAFARELEPHMRSAIRAAQRREGKVPTV